MFYTAASTKGFSGPSMAESRGERNLLAAIQDQVLVRTFRSCVSCGRNQTATRFPLGQRLGCQGQVRPWLDGVQRAAPFG